MRAGMFECILSWVRRCASAVVKLCVCSLIRENFYRFKSDWVKLLQTAVDDKTGTSVSSELLRQGMQEKLTCRLWWTPMSQRGRGW